MPTYDYECPNGHKIEVFQSISESAKPMPCVACHEKDGTVVEMAKVPSAGTVRVVGGTPTFHPGRSHK